LVRGTGRRGGARGVGGLGEALGGWGIRGISSIYYTICTYTHIHTYDYCRPLDIPASARFLFPGHFSSFDWRAKSL